MAKTTKEFAETTDRVDISDVVDDALRSLHISGSLLLRETYAPPWAVGVPNAQELAGLLKVAAGTHVVAFHLVEYGHCEITSQQGDRVLLKAGEMAVSFGGTPHRISQGNVQQTQSIESLLQGQNNTRPTKQLDHSSGTALLCGVFLLRHTEFNPLFTALPTMLHTTLSRAGELHNLSGVARLMAEEIDRKSLGSRYVVERLLEVLCADAVRAYIETTSHDTTNWFRGIQDPIIGRAMAAIHKHPGEAWSVERLAQTVAMSPSRFAARFSENIGDSPMAYLTKWRMYVACCQLTTTQQGIDQIATAVGYESTAAFNRAFKKYLGVPPASWRRAELEKSN